jgi:hypothetical protein
LCGAVASTLRITRTIFASSSIRSCRFCNRPAVSIISRSAPSARALVSASKASEAGSDPSGAVSTGTPARLPQICNCSTAAARNVSPAAITTDLPAALNWLASLPIVVVLPDPFTPTTSTTCGFVGYKRHRSRHRLHDPRHFRRQRLPQLAGRDPAPEPPFGDVRRHPHRRIDAHVGLDQQFLQAFQHGIVQHPARLLAASARSGGRKDPVSPPQAVSGSTGLGAAGSGTFAAAGSGAPRLTGAGASVPEPGLSRHFGRWGITSGTGLPRPRPLPHQRLQPLADLVGRPEHPVLELLEERHGQAPSGWFPLT